MIHLTVSAPVRKAQRPRDLVKQHAHAHTHGGTHTEPSGKSGQGRAGRVALPAGSAPSGAGTAGLCEQGCRDGRAPRSGQGSSQGTCCFPEPVQQMKAHQSTVWCLH